MPSFFQRRTIWFPTRLGWLVLLGAFLVPLVLWALLGERFLARTERVPAAGVLVVEGWIGLDGVRAAKAEFEQHGYRYIITAGGQFHHRWRRLRWNYAEEARQILLRAGVPPEKIVAAPAIDTDSQRTFETAAGVRRILDERGGPPAGVNVFTVGMHARRSRLVFAKVLPASIRVGVIAWITPDYRPQEPWWKSSERTDDFIKETVGYWFELLLNSGRWSNDPAAPPAKSTDAPEGNEAGSSPL